VGKIKDKSVTITGLPLTFTTENIDKFKFRVFCC